MECGKKGELEMGLETTVLRTDRESGVEIGDLMAIHNVVWEGFDWSLGSGVDEDARRARYFDLWKAAAALDQRAVLDRVDSSPSFTDPQRARIHRIPDESFSKCLAEVRSRIAGHSPGNSHLFFHVWENPPAETLVETCSWAFNQRMADCGFRDQGRDPVTESAVVELDPSLVRELDRAWRGIPLKLKAIRVVSWLRPEVAERMFEDLSDSHCLPPLGLPELIRLAEDIHRVAKAASDPKSRLWLLSSY